MGTLHMGFEFSLLPCVPRLSDVVCPDLVHSVQEHRGVALTPLQKCLLQDVVVLAVCCSQVFLEQCQLPCVLFLSHVVCPDSIHGLQQQIVVTFAPLHESLLQDVVVLAVRVPQVVFKF